MWELDCEESWALKNWCFWIVVLQKTLESPLDCKEIQPVHSKGDQPWLFFGRNDAEAETPVLWPPHAKSWLIGEDSDAGRDRGQEEKETTEDEMAGWHHWLNGRESQWTPGDGDGQGGLECRDSWGHKESDTTERLNWTDARDNCGKLKINSIVNLSNYIRSPDLRVSCLCYENIIHFSLELLEFSKCLLCEGMIKILYEGMINMHSHIHCIIEFHPMSQCFSCFQFLRGGH